MPDLFASRLRLKGEPDWDFFLPDEEEPFPEPGDFWVEPEGDDR